MVVPFLAAGALLLLLAAAASKKKAPPSLSRFAAHMKPTPSSECGDPEFVEWRYEYTPPHHPMGAPQREVLQSFEWLQIRLGLDTIKASQSQGDPYTQTLTDPTWRKVPVYKLPPRSYPTMHAVPFPHDSAYACSPVSTATYGSGLTAIDEYGRRMLLAGKTPSLLETFQAGANISHIPGLAQLGAAAGEALGWIADVYSNLARSEIWDVAIMGAYYMPGGGPLVSAGMRAAVEYGRGKSLQDAALAGAREALPPGPARAGFDVAIGSKDLDEAAIGIAREHVADELGPEAVGAFDVAIDQYRRRR